MKLFFRPTILSILLLAMSGTLSAQLDPNINLVGTWSKDSLPSTVLYNNTYNEVWGFKQGTREYAVIGSTQGTHFIDVTDTSDLREVDFVQGALFGYRVIHRDYHDYKGYLYMVCGEGNSTMQIVDLQYLPDSVHLVYDSDEFINIAHNIFIDSSSARLYAMAVYSEKTFNRTAGVRILSLENPQKPRFLGDYVTQSDCHDAFVRNDTVYLNMATEGLKVFDFANPEAPKELDHLFFYPGIGYNHSGWLNEEGTVYAFADETPTSPVKICDASALPDIKVLSTVKAPPDSSMVHNLIIKGNLMYVSYYNEGLYVYDISDPKQPRRYAYYDTYLDSNCRSFCGAWGVYPLLPSGKILVSDMQTGLYVFEPKPIKDSVNRGPIKVKLGPNPVANGFTVFIEGDSNLKIRLKLYNILGQVVMQTPTMFRTTLVQRGKLSPGTYIYQIFLDGKPTPMQGKLIFE